MILLESIMIGKRSKNTFHKDHLMSWVAGKYKMRFGIWRQKRNFLNKNCKKWTQWAFCSTKTAGNKLTLTFNSKNWMMMLPQIRRERLNLKRNSIKLRRKGLKSSWYSLTNLRWYWDKRMKPWQKHNLELQVRLNCTWKTVSFPLKMGFTILQHHPQNEWFMT